MSVFEHSTSLMIVLVIIAVLTLILIAAAVFLVLKSSKKDEGGKPEDGKEESKKDSEDGGMFRHPVPGMAAGFLAFREQLRNRFPGSSRWYRVPWFVMVGESKSDKTAIMEQLKGVSTGADRFDREGDEPFAPQWLLHDQAVLFDLPGRSFLSKGIAKSGPQSAAGQSSSAPASREDRKAWRSFLRLTARYRPRQPLNGIILTVPSDSLLGPNTDLDDPQRLSYIAEIADRLDDVQRLTTLNLPVYVLVTKCEKVKGFASYSRCFAKERINKRAGAGLVPEDILGWSNPHRLNTAFSSDWVDEAFDATNNVLIGRQLEMLAESSNVADADGVFLFPFELEKLRAPLTALVNRVFRTTAYRDSHLLRGIYFCGRGAPPGGEPLNASRVSADWSTQSQGFAAAGPVSFVGDLFKCKIFKERYLATPVAGPFLTRNRSVLVARATAVALILLLGFGSFRAWTRLDHVRTQHLDPVLEGLTTTLNDTVKNGSAGVAPSSDVLTSFGRSHLNEYYSPAFPYSYFDWIHRDLQETLEGTFGALVLQSCRSALEARSKELLKPIGPAQIGASNPDGAVPIQASVYPPGDSWKTDPAYVELHQYLSDWKELKTNIARYNSISSVDSGSFKEFTALLQYLGGTDFPDSSRFSGDVGYQRLLRDSAWSPVQQVDVDASKTRKLIDRFYLSWFENNPIKIEVGRLKEDIKVLTSEGTDPPTNEQIFSIVNGVRSLDSQLKDGSFDWLAENFSRKEYPALGVELESMPFTKKEGTFLDEVSSVGTARLEDLTKALQTPPVVLDIGEDKARLSGSVEALRAVLESLLGTDLMASDEEDLASEGRCQLEAQGKSWDQTALSDALSMETSRKKIEAGVLPSLPAEYKDAVRRLIDHRAVIAMWAALEDATTTASSEPTSLDDQLQNFKQSSVPLKQIGRALAALNAKDEQSCLNQVIGQQVGALLKQVNQRMQSLYGYSALTDSARNDVPVSQWLYGMTADDLAAHLGEQRQVVETDAGDVAPLVQWLQDHSVPDKLSKIVKDSDNIVKDVAALQAKAPGNPIQKLESYITSELDKVTPEAGCKSAVSKQPSDFFLNVRGALARKAVDHCRQVAILRFNEIATDFNQRLAGRFPFSQVVDTRGEAAPNEIAQFYQTVDCEIAGLDGVLPDAMDYAAQATGFLQAIKAVRPLVSGAAKDPTYKTRLCDPKEAAKAPPPPAVALSVRFRTNRDYEKLGNRIAEWKLQVGEQTLDYPPEIAKDALAVWQYGVPVQLTLRYANNSPEIPALPQTQSAMSVQDRMVTFQYTDAWSLFSFLRTHQPAPASPGGEYEVVIQNEMAPGSGSTDKALNTSVYLDVNMLPVGAKPGDEALQVPQFPYAAPLASPNIVSGE